MRAVRHSNVVFVHGFRSSPACWDSMVGRLEKDAELAGAGFQYFRFRYPTRVIEWKPGRRIPAISECGTGLGDFLERLPKADRLFLVGHSMGGLVIQSHLAQMIQEGRGRLLASLRAVILFATPNRGSTFLDTVRSLLSLVADNKQNDGLTELNTDMAGVSAVLERGILKARRVEARACPVPFRVFWGYQDGIVDEMSARASFGDARPLPGGHSEILECGDDDDGNERYAALKYTLRNPPGHPSVYDIALFEVGLAVSPQPPGTTHTLPSPAAPPTIAVDNVAIRTIRIVMSDENRCTTPYDQVYRSELGRVELLSLTQPNEASAVEQSEFKSKAQRFTYVFTPEQGREYLLRLKIYNGFGEGQRTWHNHMKANARYHLFRFVLNLKDYEKAGFNISVAPTMYFHPQDIEDHTLCANRVGAEPLPELPTTDPWVRTWEIEDVQGGVVDLKWDVDPPATLRA